MNNKTLLLIKPDSVKNKFVGKILSILEENFILYKIMSVKFDDKLAKEFYIEHKNKSFYNELVSFISSDIVVAVILLGNESIISDVRKIIGNTDFKKAEKGTIRNLFAKSLTENAVHASDSFTSYEREVKLLFGVINEE